MSFQRAKTQANMCIVRAQHELVMETATNLRRRYERYMRNHNRMYSYVAFGPTAKSLTLWLNDTTFEQTYMWHGDGYDLSVRQRATIELLEVKVPAVTIGIGQTTDWFLVALGKQLTKYTPGSIVTIGHAITNSRERLNSPSMKFIIKPVPMSQR